MANHLPTEKKILVLSLLTEGQSIRACSRITGVDQNTIMSLLVKSGQQARDIHDSMMVNINSSLIQCDELYALVGKHQRFVKEGEENKCGEFYTFIALDSQTKLVPCYRVGKRTSKNATSFMMELATRVPSEFQLSTDSFSGYFNAVDRVFGESVHYGQIHKKYEETIEASEKRYSPPRIISVTKKSLIGKPNPKYISTSHCERLNLSLRMEMRRFTRLTNGHSKKLENHEAAVDLYFFFYNFLRIHRTLRVTPAMEAKVTNRLWSWEDLLNWNEERIAA